MRKLFCLFLALLMLPCAALADAALTPAMQEVTLYTHPTFGYTISLPADWLLMDNETIDDIYNAVINGEIEGIDSANLDNQRAQILTTDMMMALSPDSLNNMNVVASDLGIAVNEDAFIAAVCPQIVANYNASYPGSTITDAGSIIEIGGKKYVRVALIYTIDYLALRLNQYIALDDSIMYCLTFVNTGFGEAISEEDMDAICLPCTESFTIAE